LAAAKKPATKTKNRKGEATRARANGLAGILLIGLGVFAFFAIFTPFTGVLGTAVKSFFCGMFGLVAYAMPFLLAIFGWLTLIAPGRKINASKVALSVFAMAMLLLFLHLFWHGAILAETTADGYAAYLLEAYAYGRDLGRGVGLVAGLIAYPAYILLGTAGSFILSVVALILSFALLTKLSLSDMGKKLSDGVVRGARTAAEYTKLRISEGRERRSEERFYEERDFAEEGGYAEEPPYARKRPYDEEPEALAARRAAHSAPRVRDRSILEPFDEDRQGFGEQFPPAPPRPALAAEGPARARPFLNEDLAAQGRPGRRGEAFAARPEPEPAYDDRAPWEEAETPPLGEGWLGYAEPGAYEAAQMDSTEYGLEDDAPKSAPEPPAPRGERPQRAFGVVEEGETPPPAREAPRRGFFGVIEDEEEEGQKNPSVADFDYVQEEKGEAPRFTALPKQEIGYVYGDRAEAAIDPEALAPYRFPPLGLLAQPKRSTQDFRKEQDEQARNVELLEETLSSFGIQAKVLHVSKGPAITRYELQPARGVKVSRITGLADDIALNMAAVGVRIEAPIPGKAAIGIEIANSSIDTVTLREVLESRNFVEHPSKLAFSLGKDISGEAIVADLARMPHLLIAGATGSGKSVCINSLIASILYKATPEEVRLILIDPKVVELSVYNSIPHLLIPVVTDPKKAAGALGWAVAEMTERYKLFAKTSTRDLKGYNGHILQRGGEPLPQIVVVIDELADLMMVASGDVEDRICRLAQLARAAGIHLVIATQRPSVNVITGVIKANIPARIAFAVASQVDSRTILDVSGAEKLLGRGDMLFAPGNGKSRRVQGAFITDEEVTTLVEYIKARSRPDYDPDFIEAIEKDDEGGAKGMGEDDGEEGDDLLRQAVELAIDSGQISASMLQRRFRVGYARAGRLLDEMEKRKLISGFEGSKPRQVLVGREEYDRIFGNSNYRRD
jgi:DNA segregation ATPase FtsK/SpoIIIE-like protein